MSEPFSKGGRLLQLKSYQVRCLWISRHPVQSMLLMNAATLIATSVLPERLLRPVFAAFEVATGKGNARGTPPSFLHHVDNLRPSAPTLGTASSQAETDHRASPSNLLVYILTFATAYFCYRQHRLITARFDDYPNLPSSSASNKPRCTRLWP